MTYTIDGWNSIRQRRFWGDHDVAVVDPSSCSRTSHRRSFQYIRSYSREELSRNIQHIILDNPQRGKLSKHLDMLKIQPAPG